MNGILDEETSSIEKTRRLKHLIGPELPRVRFPVERIKNGSDLVQTLTNGADQKLTRCGRELGGVSETASLLVSTLPVACRGGKKLFEPGKNFDSAPFQKALFLNSFSGRMMIRHMFRLL